MKKRTRKRIISGVFIGAFLAVVIALGIFLSMPEKKISKAYPKTVLQADIPQYPDAWVTNPGKNTTPDYFSIRLRSTKPLADIADFYEAELLTDNWQTPEDGLLDSGFFIQKFTRDSVAAHEDLQLTLEQQGEEVSIALLYRKTVK